MKLQGRLIIFLILLSKGFYAQEKPLAFNLVTASKSVSVGKITSITQDKWGFMWFVDQGNSQLIKYDGYRMKVFKTNSSDSNSISTSGFECIAADSLGNIWFPTNGGVDKLNSNTGVSTHYKIKMGAVGAIIVDHLGFVWLGATDGLYEVDPKTGTSIHYPHDEHDPTTISGGDVRVLYEDHEGTIWVGNGFPFRPDKAGGLNKFNRVTGKFIRYLHDPDNPHSIINDKVRAIFEDSRGIFWVGTLGDGLHIMDRKTGTFERLIYDPAHPEKLSRPPIKKGPYVDHITFIKEDISGDIWIGTYQQGLTRYNPVTRKVTHFIADKTTPNGFADSTTWCAFTSRDGTLWIATEQSNLLYRVDPFRKSIRTILTGSGANSFLEDKEGYLWAGTEGNGIFKFDQNKNAVEHFKHDPDDPSSLYDDHVMINMLPNDDSKILAENYNGLNILDRHTNKIYAFSKDREFKDSAGYGGFVDVIQDENGINWFACWGRGLIRYDPKNNSIKQFLPDPKDSTSISTNNLNHLIEDKAGGLWIGSGDGINNLNRQTGRFKHYVRGSFIASLYEDSRSNIWAGTEKGLYRYDKKKDDFYAFFDPYSEIGSNAVGSIIEDNNQNLWINSNSAIMKVNPLTSEVFIYGEKFGINQNTMTQVAKPYKAKTGQLFFNYGDGFCFFYPQELTVKSDFKIAVTGLSINSIPVVPGKLSVLQEPIEEISNVDLKYNQNNIAFDFSAFDYRDPESIRYVARLENNDNTWREVTGEKSSYYFNLAPGTYFYHIKAFNKDGATAEKIITITVHPPWWQTWWFRIAAVVCFGGALYALIRWRVHQKFKAQLERSERERQVAELKQKSAEMEMQALRAQMNPHFIFNSLNSINMFILENNKLQASEYLSKFSRLVRLILQNSQEALVPLGRELEAFRLYLELEALRFENKFEYKITVAGNVDTTMLRVPPLIIQPYAENAIWHGLMHKREKGHLEIDVYGEDEMLFYKITDDGIGRKEAAELKSRSASTQKSMGMRITADRIAMLQHRNETSITITDLVLPDGNPGGTEVLIKIPIIYD